MVLQKQESMDEIILRYQDQFSLTSIINYIKQLNKDCFNDALKKARQDEKLLIQPRAGEGGHQGMLSLINKLSKSGVADLLPVTIDAYTRLLDFTTPAFLKETNPDMLNGYPLVSHGFLKGREINESTTLPIEVRHGSPDGRELFLIALASGFTSYEGGGISYFSETGSNLNKIKNSYQNNFENLRQKNPNYFLFKGSSIPKCFFLSSYFNIMANIKPISPSAANIRMGAV